MGAACPVPSSTRSINPLKRVVLLRLCIRSRLSGVGGELNITQLARARPLVVRPNLLLLHHLQDQIDRFVDPGVVNSAGGTIDGHVASLSTMHKGIKHAMLPTPHRCYGMKGSSHA
eukprot:3002778-Pyramimonas_sp.AAC.1